MRRLTTGLGFAVVLASLAPGATAGMYGRIEAGVSSGDVSGVVTAVPGIFGLGSSVDESTESGFVGFAVLGFDLGGPLSLEAELGTSSPTLPGDWDVSDLSELTIMANAVATFDVAEAIGLVVGAGIGLDSYTWDSYNTSSPTSSEENDLGFAYQAIAGLDIGVADGVDLTLRYRYRVASVDVVGAYFLHNGATAVYADLDKVETQSLTVGLKFGF